MAAGWLVEVLGWEWVFLATALIGIIGLLLVWLSVSESRDPTSIGLQPFHRHRWFRRLGGWADDDRTGGTGFYWCPSSPPRWKIWGAAWVVVAVFMLSNAPTTFYLGWQQQLGFSSGTLVTVFTAYIGGLISVLLIAGRL